jgi:hypothetical protein
MNTFSSLSSVSLAIKTTKSANTTLPTNTNFITSGLNTPIDIKYFNGNLYISNYNTNNIGLYNGTTGATYNASFKSLGYTPYCIDIDISNNILYVTKFFNGGGVGKYTATTGADINTSSVTGLNFPSSILLEGSYLYVSVGGIINVYTPGTTAVFQKSVSVGFSNYHLSSYNGNIFSCDFANGSNSIDTWQTYGNGMVISTTTPTIHPFITTPNPNTCIVVGNFIYVDQAGSGNTIAKFSLAGALVNSTFIQVLNAGASPHGMCANPNQQNMYVCDSAINKVYLYAL